MTLVELVVTLAVAAILMAIAVPNFIGIANGGRLTSSGNELVAGLQSARMEAIRRGRAVVLCSSADGAACGASSTGWMIFVDTDRDRNRDLDEEVLRAATVSGTVQISGSTNIENAKVVFNPDGFARKTDGVFLNARMRLCIETKTPEQNIREITIGSGSRISIDRVNGAGACAAPTNPAPITI